MGQQLHRHNLIWTVQSPRKRSHGIRVSSDYLVFIHCYWRHLIFISIEGSRRNNSHAGHTNDSKAYRQPHSFRGDPYNTISPQVYNLKSNESPWQMANPVGALPPAAPSHAHADSAPTHHTDATQSKSGTHLDNVDLMPSTLDAAQRKTLPAWIR